MRRVKQLASKPWSLSSKETMQELGSCPYLHIFTTKLINLPVQCSDDSWLWEPVQLGQGALPWCGKTLYVGHSYSMCTLLYTGRRTGRHHRVQQVLCLRSSWEIWVELNVCIVQDALVPGPDRQSSQVCLCQLRTSYSTTTAQARFDRCVSTALFLKFQWRQENLPKNPNCLAWMRLRHLAKMTKGIETRVRHPLWVHIKASKYLHFVEQVQITLSGHMYR